MESASLVWIKTIGGDDLAICKDANPPPLPASISVAIPSPVGPSAASLEIGKTYPINFVVSPEALSDPAPITRYFVGVSFKITVTGVPSCCEAVVVGSNGLKYYLNNDVPQVLNTEDGPLSITIKSTKGPLRFSAFSQPPDLLGDGSYMPADSEYILVTAPVVPPEKSIVCWQLLSQPGGCSISKLNGFQARLVPGHSDGFVKVLAMDQDGCVYIGDTQVRGRSNQCCGSCLDFGNSRKDSGSIFFQLFLGKDRYDNDAGSIYLKYAKRPQEFTPIESPIDPKIPANTGISDTTPENAPIRHRFTQPNALKVSFEEMSSASLELPNCVVVRQLGELRQVRVPSGLVDIKQASPNSLEVSCYDPTQFVEGPATTGFKTSLELRSIIPGSQPFVKYILSQPGGSTDRLEIHEYRDGPPTKYLYTWGPSGWERSVDGGDEYTVSEEIVSPSGIIRKSKSMKGIGTSAVLTRSEELNYQIRNGVFRTVSRTVGPLQTTYDYYTSGDASGELRLIQMPGGRWIHYAKYDAMRRVEKIVLPLGDQIFSETPANSESIEYLYTLNGEPDSDPDEARAKPRCMIRRVNGIETARTYYLYYWGFGGYCEETRRCRTPGAGVNDPTNLKSVRRYRSTRFIQTPLIFSRVENEDGTFTEYSYHHTSSSVADHVFLTIQVPGGGVFSGMGRSFSVIEGANYEEDPVNNPDYWAHANLTTSVSSGHRALEGGVYIEKVDQREVTIRSLNGTILEHAVYDSTQPGDPLLVQSDLYWYINRSGSADALGRSYVTSHMDGTTEWSFADCCGAGTQIGRDGSITKYGYDAWGHRNRVMKEVDHFLKTGPVELSTLDINGNELETIRYSTDSLKTTRVRKIEYLPDGTERVFRRYNPLGGILTYSYAAPSNPLKIEERSLDGAVRTRTYFRDGTLASQTGDGVAATAFTRTVVTDPTDGVARFAVTETKLDAAGNLTAEFKQSFYDALGNVVTERFNKGDGTTGNVFKRYFYNAKNQLWKTVDPDGVMTLYGYNAQGNRTHTAIADQAAGPRSGATGNEDNMGYIDISKDRVSADLSFPSVRIPSATPYYVMRRQHLVSRAGKMSLVSQEDEGLNATAGWSTLYRDQNDGSSPSIAETSWVQSYDGFNTVRTTTGPNLEQRIETWNSEGVLASVRLLNADGVLLESETYSYRQDPFYRLYQRTDSRNGSTTFTYNAADQIETVTMPDPDGGAATQTSLYTYDPFGRLWSVRYPDTTFAYRRYYPSGQLKLSWGSRTTPQGFEYDAQGRMTKLHTWTSFQFTGDPTVSNPALPTGSAATRWFYDPTRGWLIAKRMPGETTSDTDFGTRDYEYTPAGRLRWKQQRRLVDGSSTTRVRATYGYDLDAAGGSKMGDLRSITYNDGLTPAVTVSAVDQQGRIRGVVHGENGAVSTTLDYNNLDQLLTEGNVGGVLSGSGIEIRYDSTARRTQLIGSRTGTSTVLTQNYLYDRASRLWAVNDGTYGSRYEYEPKSSLVKTVRQGPWVAETVNERVSRTSTYDAWNQLKSITTTVNAAAQPQLGRTLFYNLQGLRDRQELGDGSQWKYKYDDAGEVLEGKHVLNGGPSVPGQQFEYLYDSIGNRTTSKSGGDVNGANLRTSSYTLVNAADPTRNLNQYQQRRTPRFLDVQGSASPTETVEVSGTGPYINGGTTVRQGGYFRSEIAIGGNNAISETVSITTSKGLKRSGQILVPPDPEAFEYDADGNLTRDGHWKYTWDGENRLIAVTSGVGPKPSVQYAYDYAGRMVKRTESFGGQSKTTLYLYEGFRCIAEFDGSGGLQRTYTWGMDLSGGLSGAGGVEGLLSMKSVASGTYFYSYDGNGNVVGLFGANNGVQVAAYEYGPFGEPLRTSGGAVANENRYRFSTKRTDPVTDLVHYEYRVYDPRNGRWISRDPLGESEINGINLYSICKNRTTMYVDTDGRQLWMLGNPLGSSPAQARKPGYCAFYESLVFPPFGDDYPVFLQDKYTDWYLNRFPGTTAFAMDSFKKNIDLQLQRQCRSIGCIKTPESPILEINGYLTGEGERSTKGTITEEVFGDIPQSTDVDFFDTSGVTSAVRDLGNYHLRVSNYHVVSRRKGDCTFYSWTANVIVVDSLGLDIDNLGPTPSWQRSFLFTVGQVAAPKRLAVVAAFPISGAGKCCK